MREFKAKKRVQVGDTVWLEDGIFTVAHIAWEGIGIAPNCAPRFKAPWVFLRGKENHWQWLPLSHFSQTVTCPPEIHKRLIHLSIEA